MWQIWHKDVFWITVFYVMIQQIKKRRKIVDLSKITIKKIRELIVFTALLVVALWKFDVVLDVLKAIWGILFPFVLGGAIAFVTNVPMSFLEKKIFGRVKKEMSNSKNVK